jgi:hypothetical protein
MNPPIGSCEILVAVVGVSVLLGDFTFITVKERVIIAEIAINRVILVFIV